MKRALPEVREEKFISSGWRSVVFVFCDSRHLPRHLRKVKPLNQILPNGSQYPITNEWKAIYLLIAPHY